MHVCQMAHITIDIISNRISLASIVTPLEVLLFYLFLSAICISSAIHWQWPMERYVMCIERELIVANLIRTA